MIFYRCKCGKAWSYGSIPPAKCAKCAECGSDLAPGPDSHLEPGEHDFSMVEEIETDQGKATITRCTFCHRTKKEVEGKDGT